MKIAPKKMFGFAVLACVLGAAAYLAAVWYVNDVETPDFKVVNSEGAFEIRDYPSLIVAEVVRNGDRKAAIRGGFSPLASYIFAKKREGEPIAMTAPVTQSKTDAGEAWTVRFVMPEAYSLDMLPRPADEDVRLVQIPAVRRAAVQFSGVATDELLAEKESSLRAWLSRQGLQVTGSATYAFYNAPFTIGFLRRNEVLLQVVAD